MYEIHMYIRRYLHLLEVVLQRPTNTYLFMHLNKWVVKLKIKHPVSIVFLEFI